MLNIFNSENEPTFTIIITKINYFLVVKAHSKLLTITIYVSMEAQNFGVCYYNILLNDCALPLTDGKKTNICLTTTTLHTTTSHYNLIFHIHWYT